MALKWLGSRSKTSSCAKLKAQAEACVVKSKAVWFWYITLSPQSQDVVQRGQSTTELGAKFMAFRSAQQLGLLPD